MLATDREGRNVILFADEWGVRHFTKRHPEVELSPTENFSPDAPASTQAATNGRV